MTQAHHAKIWIPNEAHCTLLKSEDMPMFAMSQVVPALLARFREREETVKADVFATFVSLLQQVCNLSDSVLHMQVHLLGASCCDAAEALSTSELTHVHASCMQIGEVAKYDHSHAEGPLAKLAADSPGIIKVQDAAVSSPAMLHPPLVIDITCRTNLASLTYCCAVSPGFCKAAERQVGKVKGRRAAAAAAAGCGAAGQHAEPHWAAAARAGCHPECEHWCSVKQHCTGSQLLHVTPFTLDMLMWSLGCLLY